MTIRKRLLAVTCFIVLVTAPASAQRSTTPAQPNGGTTSAEFARTADEIMAEMSKLLSLPILQPLKKSVRSKQEIRDYLIRTQKEDKDTAKRYADTRVLEVLGLIPK